jgi:hydrogenase maturation protease
VTDRVSVLALGNVLMRDDAWGPWTLAALLAGWELPAGVTAVDLGTPGLDLSPWLADADVLLLVDTVRAPAAPGTLHVYDRAQILATPPQPRLSPHDPGLKEALLSATLAGTMPREVVLVGAVPGDTSMGIGLTPALRAAVVPGAAAVVEALARLGVAAVRRRDARPAEVWWESPPSG